MRIHHRRVGIRLCNNENISSVIEGFMDVFDVPQVSEVAAEIIDSFRGCEVMCLLVMFHSDGVWLLRLSNTDLDRLPCACCRFVYLLTD